MILILTIIVLFLFLTLFFWYTGGGWTLPQEEKYRSFHDHPPVDVVITWVDGDDEEFRADLFRHGSPMQYDRFQSNQEIRFCLRSIEKYMTFIRKIFIVLRDGQKIPFLQSHHYQVEIVHHSQIIPLEYLPTFNSLVIENFLHKIPSLSEHYIYFNDDVILLQKVSYSTFFDELDLPIQSDDLWRSVNVGGQSRFWHSQPNFQKKIKMNFNIELSSPLSSQEWDKHFSLYDLVYQNCEILDMRFGHSIRTRSQHIPHACRKSQQLSLDSFLQKLFLEEKSLYELTSTYKFRDRRSIARYSFFKKYWDIHQYGCSSHVYPLLSLVVDGTKDIQHLTETLLHTDKMFLILHNEISVPNEKSTKNFESVIHTLYQKFPQKSSFER